MHNDWGHPIVGRLDCGTSPYRLDAQRLGMLKSWSFRWWDESIKSGLDAQTIEDTQESVLSRPWGMVGQQGVTAVP